MPSQIELEPLARLFAERAAYVLRTGFRFQSLSVTNFGWQVRLASHGLELRIEIHAGGAAGARILVRYRPGGRRHVLSRAVSATDSWSPTLYSAELSVDAGVPAADAVLAHVRSRVIGDPRSERLLVA